MVSAQHNEIQSTKHVVIIGAGPAGLTAAYELTKQGIQSTVLEADNTVGGIARTAEYKGYLFDMGGHRFFTKVAIVEQMWREVLGDELLSRPRLSRIYYKKKFFSYPLEPRNALQSLGLTESLRCGLSYIRSRLLPVTPEPDFETWVSNRFGRRLFEIFFRTYTEKVWGMSCKQIRSDWAAQRIKDLSLASALANALWPRRVLPKASVIKTLINEFLYPRRGPGMMWEKTRQLIEANGNRVLLSTPVGKIFWEPGRVTGVEAGGKLYQGTHYISSMPIRDLVHRMVPQPPEALCKAAGELRYRDFLTVAVIVKERGAIPDNWIYIHDPEVKVGRIQNYKSWSPDMVPDPSTTCLGLEYFCFEHDQLWDMPDTELIALARREIVQLGLSRPEDFLDGTVVRVRKAYPVYDEKYLSVLAQVRAFLTELPNLQLVGRNGMHRYNNQDHSMLTAMLATRNILGASFDLWQVNAEEEYLEMGGGITESDIIAMERSQPFVPERV